MEMNVKKKIENIVDGKLSENETAELIEFIRYAFFEGFNKSDEYFFKDLAFEMSASVKDLAIMLIDFRKDLKSKLHPEIADLAERYIPQTADQLEGIIETTEKAVFKIMDNLEKMQDDAEYMLSTFRSLREEGTGLKESGRGAQEAENSSRAIEIDIPLIDRMESVFENQLAMIADMFVQMSFQDLTGQRIIRVMDLVSQMEVKLKRMIVSFGMKVAAKEKNPEITPEELQAVVTQKETELDGPQRDGIGLDQDGIDELLANI